MVGRKLEDAVAEPDFFGALARRGEKGFRRRRVRIFLQEMVLDHPGVVVAEPVGGLELGQRVLIEPELVAVLPWARQLQLIEDAEFHDASPDRSFLLLTAIVMVVRALSIARQFHRAGDAFLIPRSGRWFLALDLDQGPHARPA
jgi:hypothetical protein